MAPRRRQSLKAQRKDKKRHTRNQQVKTALKKTLKKLEEAKQTLKEAISKLAKAAKKGILHKNTAQRKISRLAKRLTKLGQGA